MHGVPKFVALAAAALTLITLAGCTSTPTPTASASAACEPAKGKVTLNYWSWIPGIDKAVDKFNATHPKIHVNLKTVVSASAYQNLFNALKAKNAPDLAMIEYASLPSFRLQDGLTDISGCKPVANLKKEVAPWTYNQVTLGTKALYATPTDVAPLAMYYRKDIFTKYGIAVPTTWAQYEEAGKELKAKNPSIALTSFSSGDAGLLLSLGWQNGARPFGYSGEKVVLDMTSPAMTKVADYWQNLVDEKLVNTDLQIFSPQQYAAWNNGTIATSIGAVWQSAVMESGAPGAKGDWAVAPLPQWTAGGSASANYGGATTAVIAGTRHPYEASVFADWMSTSKTAGPFIYAAGGLLAANHGSTDAEIQAPQAYFGGQQIFAEFEKASRNIDTGFSWAPDQTNVNNYLSDAVVKSLAGNGTLADALGATQQKAVADLTSQSIEVTVKH